MGSGLLFDQQHRPSTAGFMVGAGALGFVTVLVVASLATAAGLRLGITALAGLSIASGLVLGPLSYWALIRPLARRLPGASANRDTTSLVDPVTHTLSRPGITSSLLEAMAQAQRYGTPLCVAVLRIDGFDQQLERQGNAGADALAQWAAAVMTETLRMPDRVGSQQPGEFLVVMPQTRGPAALKVAERLLAALAVAPGAPVPATLSAGVAEFGKGQDLEKLLSRATQAAQEAAENGGNHAVRAKAQRAPRRPSVAPAG